MKFTQRKGDETVNWNEIADRSLRGEAPTREEAYAVLNAPDEEILSLLNAAFRVRHRFHGWDVRLHVLQNAKSGLCRENCSFCSQAIGAQSGVNRYHMQSVEELVEGARKAHEMKAVKYCMVTATRGPSDKEMDIICEAVRRIKAEIPINICTSLGLLNDEQAKRLAEAGVNRFNHNLETSRNYFPNVCQTHHYEDRVATVKAAKSAGMEACCGGIVGMGETVDDRVDLAYELRELEVESIPVNFLDPRPGTPLAHVPRLKPIECLKTLCMFRFVNPSRDIRVAGGREVNLRDMQAFALYPANSMFSEGYLTTGGQGYDKDIRMIEDAGFRLAELVTE
ncbi:MAG TPA: biotin synthase BioB [Kiritimatiellia bacterium]|nr:biotin synthase BioB [Kiritimatiellia bacterium]